MRMRPESSASAEFIPKIVASLTPIARISSASCVRVSGFHASSRVSTVPSAFVVTSAAVALPSGPRVATCAPAFTDVTEPGTAEFQLGSSSSLGRAELLAGDASPCIILCVGGA